MVGRTGLDLGWTSRRCMFAQSLSEGSAKASFGFEQQQRELTEPCDSVCSCKPITTKQTIHRCSKTGDDRHSTQLLRIASLWPPTRHKTECQGLRGRWTEDCGTPCKRHHRRPSLANNVGVCKLFGSSVRCALACKPHFPASGRACPRRCRMRCRLSRHESERLARPLCCHPR